MKPGPKPIPIEENFWSKVKKTETCWLWTGSVMSSGYGHIRTRKNSIQKNISAHRFSYSFHKGQIPRDKFVLHNCEGFDNKLCVNPSHLWLGTQADNMRHAFKKGMVKRGSLRAHSKLKESDIPLIFKSKKEGKTQRAISKIFGVHEVVIHHILKRDTWTHVPVPDNS